MALGPIGANPWLIYANQGATRNHPLSPKLTGALGSFLPDMGVSMKVFSGGQDATGPHRTGSHRHDDGNAADVFFYKGGHQLDWANPKDVPVFQDIVRQGRAAGLTGFGAGDGYMQPGSMHIGYGSPAVWGAGGSGANAPGWLRQASMQPATPSPPVETPSISPPPPASSTPGLTPDPKPSAGMQAYAPSQQPGESWRPFGFLSGGKSPEQNDKRMAFLGGLQQAGQAAFHQPAMTPFSGVIPAAQPGMLIGNQTPSEKSKAALLAALMGGV